MSRLTDEEILEVQKFIDRAKAQFAERQLVVEVDTDLSNWVNYAERATKDHKGLQSPITHDPRASNVHPGNSFWVAIREKSRPLWAALMGRERLVAGCAAHRVVETDNIIEEIRTQRIYSDKVPRLDFKPVKIVATDNAPVISGKVGFTGGFWIHPKYRGATISGTLSRLVRLLSIRHFDIDWSINFARDTSNRTAMFNQSYGFPNSISITKGYYPPYDTDLDMQMNYIHRTEILEQLRSENAEAEKSGSTSVSDTGERRAPSVH